MAKLYNLTSINDSYGSSSTYGLTSHYFSNNNRTDWSLITFASNYEKNRKLLRVSDFIKYIMNEYLMYGKKYGLYPDQTLKTTAMASVSIANLNNYRLLNNFSDLSSGSSAKQYRLGGFSLRNKSSFSSKFTSSTWQSYLNYYGWTYRSSGTYGAKGFYTADKNSNNTMLIIPYATNELSGDVIPRYACKFDHDFFGECLFNASSTYDVGSYDNAMDSIQFFISPSNTLILSDVTVMTNSTDTIRVTPIFLCIDWSNLNGTFGGANDWHSVSSTTALIGNQFNYSESGEAVNNICYKMRPSQSNNNWTSQSYYSYISQNTVMYGIFPVIYFTDKFIKAGTSNGSSMLGFTPTKYLTTFTYTFGSGASAGSFSDSNEYTMYNNQYLRYGPYISAILNSLNSTTGFVTNKMNKSVVMHEIDWYDINTLYTSVVNTNNSTYLSNFRKFLNYYFLGTYGTTIPYIENNAKGYLPILKRSWVWLFSYISSSQICNYICAKRKATGCINQALTDNSDSPTFSGYNNSNRNWYNYFDAGATGGGTKYMNNVYPWGIKTNFSFNNSISDNIFNSAAASISGAPTGKYYVNRHVYFSNDIEDADNYGEGTYLLGTSSGNIISKTIDF